MDDLIGEFDALKFSALSKSIKINSFVHNVTLGPDSIHQDQTVEEVPVPPKEKPKKTYVQVEKPSTNASIVFKRVLQEIEYQRSDNAKQAINERCMKFIEFSKQQESARKNTWCQNQLRIVSDIRRQETTILQALDQRDTEHSAQCEQITQYYKSLAEKRLRAEKEQLLKEKRKQQVNVIIDNIKSNQGIFRKVYQEISVALKPVSQEDFRKYFSNIPQELKKLAGLMEDVVKNCVSGKISEQEVTNSANVVQKIYEFKASILSTISTQNLLGEGAGHNPSAAESRPQEAQQITSADLTDSNPYTTPSTLSPSALPPSHVPPPGFPSSTFQTPTSIFQTSTSPSTFQTTTPPSAFPPSTAPPPTSTPQSISKSSPSTSSKINLYGSKSSLILYAELQQYIQVYEETYKDLLNDPSYKQYRFDCKKAINIPVNAISATSREHLLDKYNKLYNLLAGNKVPVGDSTVVATKHPQGISFCTDLLARKFVLQGDLMISSNPDASYAYAFIIVELWKKFPDFGRLLLGHFYKQCPYLVPIYPPKTVDQTDEEFYLSQGYQYNDGVIEKQDKFLKRISGIMRLYATIMIMKFDGQFEGSEMYGLSQAWQWLASILNLPPRHQITATITHVFLETTGYSLQKVYGQQFKKVMGYVIMNYLPILQRSDSGGPLTRLEVMLKEYIENRGFVRPSTENLGILQRDFYI